MSEIAVGVDIGATFTKLGIVTREGTVLRLGSFGTVAHADVESFADALSGRIFSELAETGEAARCAGIGIGAPNGNYYRGTIEYAPNLKWEGVLPLARMMADRTGMPVALTNDANAAALGELLYGDARGMTDFIVITLGTGLGSGFVSRGDVLYGSDGFAGELGHTIAVPDGRECGCGRRGCLETYASVPGLLKTLEDVLAESEDPSALRDLTLANLTAETVTELAQMGDSVALLSFERTGAILGRSLANAVAITSPTAIFLLGGLTRAGDLIFGPTRRHLQENLHTLYAVDLLPSGLPADHAGVMGAAALVWKEEEKALSPARHH